MISVPPSDFDMLDIVGTIADEPFSTVTSTGKRLTKLSVVVTRPPSKAGGGSSKYYKVNFWEGKHAELLASAKKGSRVRARGKWGISKYTKKDGTQGESIDLNDPIEFAVAAGAAFGTDDLPF